ncbi:MAG: spore photoproduct lyase family protein [Candidatus Diapherotrites archaeon]
MQVKEIQCKSLLNKSGIPGCDYAINPYMGCMNGCIYCYATFMRKFSEEEMEWGSFVHVKANAIEVLRKELKKRKPGEIMLSSVTDPYQAIEAKYMLTRKILELLAKKNFPLSILTKNKLVLRDIDLLKKLDSIEVGLTITGLDEINQRKFEPLTSPHSERIKALRKLHEAGIKNYAFIGPILPNFTDLKKVFSDLKGIVDYAFVDKLNLYYWVKMLMQKKLSEEDFRKILVSESYWNETRKEIIGLARENGIKLKLLF